MDRQTYFSEHGIPLVYEQVGHTTEILTVENYIKWYSIYLIRTNGVVHRVDESNFNQSFEGTAWNDHAPTPAYCEWLAGQLGAKWDSCSLDMVVGRWLSDTFELTATEIQRAWSSGRRSHV